MTDIIIPECPQDTISNILFTPQDSIITCSWDSQLCQFDQQGELQSHVQFHAPLLDVAYSHFNRQVYTGGLDGILYECTMSESKPRQIGIPHENSISCLVWNDNHSKYPFT